MTWGDFSLPGCATGPDGPDGQLVLKFQEYPIIKGGIWKGGAVGQGNHRVAFQVVNATTAAYCGIVRHPGRNTVRTHFQACKDINTPPVALYAAGTCSLHLT